MGATASPWLPADVGDPQRGRGAQRLAAAAVPAAWFALLIAVPAAFVGHGWEPWLVGVALLLSAVTGLLAPRIAAPLPTRIGPTLSLVLAAGRGHRPDSNT